MNSNRIRRYRRHVVLMSSLLVLGVTLCPDIAAQQTVKSIITGQVKDAENGEPLAAVNVYLSFTTIGTSTDSAGRFAIINVPMGVFDLIASRVGYERRVVPLKIVARDSLHYEIALNPQMLKAPEVEVMAESPREWKENLDRFVRAFIGETDHSSQCSILNPEVLSFHRTNDTLVARADSVLQIDNEALGYRLYVVVKEFTWNTEMDYGRYLIYPFFQAKKAGDAEERERWEKNRKMAYEGSLKHFLHSLYVADVEAEMFTVFSGSFKKLATGQGHRVSPNEFNLEPMTGTPFKTLQFPGELRVEYGHQRAEDDQHGYSWQKLTIDLRSASIISLNHSYALIDSLGNLFDPFSIEVSGRWAKNRLAELLPMH
ncbi:MAG: carboxypeptidase-like regulatory domain-containing protein [Bacteroidota bacterium]